MDEALNESHKADEVIPVTRAAPPRRGAKRRHIWAMLGSAFSMIVFLGLIVGGTVFGVLALTGKTIVLPRWVVAAVENELRAAIPDTLSLSLGTIAVLVDDGWVPRLAVHDLRIISDAGETLVLLPESRADFDAAAFARGELRPSSLRLMGAQIALVRDGEGRFNIDFGFGVAAQVAGFADLIDQVEGAFTVPALQKLREIEVTGLSLSLTDALTGQNWQVGDGRLVILNDDTALTAELGLTLAGQTQASGHEATGTRTGGQVAMTFATQKATSAARITARVTGIATPDLAAQVPQLAVLQILDAPLSGEMTAALGPEGALDILEGAFEIGPGTLRPPVGAGAASLPFSTPEPFVTPLPFERAALGLSYDPGAARLNITRLDVKSPATGFSAQGHVLLQDAGGAPLTGDLHGSLPARYLVQLAISDVLVDPHDAFAAPVSFGRGAIDLRLQFDPFRVQIGQFSLGDDGHVLRAAGWAEARTDGWHAALDIALDEIPAQRLLDLWPLRLVPMTRRWLAENVRQGILSDVNGAVRLTPGQEPRLLLGYEFRDAEVRFLRSLPPIIQGRGHATLEGARYVIVLDGGTITPPAGGSIDVAGSVFEIPDITERPNTAVIDLLTQSSLTAALSLLDQPPFGFLTRAGRPVDLGAGEARIASRLTIPLVPLITVSDVEYTVSGDVTDLDSGNIVTGRRVTAPLLRVSATPAGLEIAGEGRLGALPFDVTFRQGFGPEARGRSSIAGSVTLSAAAADDLGLGLPDGFLRGQTQADVTIDLRRGEAARLSLTSGLGGLGLTVPALGWSKARDQSGRLEVDATLSSPPRVTRLDLAANGLRAVGEISLRPGGRLNEAQFSRLSLDDWLDVSVTLTGQGRGPATLAVTGGSIDLRQMPRRAGGDADNAGGAFTLRLDRLAVTDTIAFTGFRGEFTPQGGLNGSFNAGVNGSGAVTGTLVAATNGPAVRIRSDDAGLVLAAAGVFSAARGGSLDLQLVSRAGGEGVFDGRAEIAQIRVRNANVLAELLNAVSVIGLLEQLNGTGIVFNTAEIDFRLTPRAIEISRASAVGASLGVSMAGVYQTASREVNLQGVISPIYLVNGVGAVLTRRGEGLFGFSYRLSGTADNPEIGVNPLSILTPGMFRDLFRRPAPVLEDTE